MLDVDAGAADASVNVTTTDGEDSESDAEFYPASSDLPTPTTMTRGTQFRGKPHRKTRGMSISMSLCSSAHFSKPHPLAGQTALT